MNVNIAVSFVKNKNSDFTSLPDIIRLCPMIVRNECYLYLKCTLRNVLTMLNILELENIISEQ